MMKSIKFLLPAFFGLLFITSCAKETKCILESTSYTDGINAIYEYDDQNRISRVNYYDALNGNTLAAYYLISRNGEGKISSVDYRYAAGTAIFYYAATYNSNGDLGTVFRFDNSQNDFIADELYSSTYYYYGTDSKVDSTVMYFGLNKRSTTLLWSGDNVAGLSHRFNDVLQYSRTFEYDNLNQAFGNIAELEQIVEFDTGEPSVRSFSKNNVVEMSHYDAVGGLIGTYNYTHTANAEGNVGVYNGVLTLNYRCE